MGLGCTILFCVLLMKLILILCKDLVAIAAVAGLEYLCSDWVNGTGGWRVWERALLRTPSV